MVFYRVKIFAAFFLLGSLAAANAQETAYQALNTVGSSKGQGYLDHLLTLEGVDGTSQPRSWRMIFEDGTSRGGYREIEVSGGRITSQRTPLKGPAGSAARMNLDRLQLDSDGAYTVAQREAAGQGVRFASANYLLEAGESGTPIWKVRLLDESGAAVQAVRITADNGSVIGGRGAPVRTAPNRDYVQDLPDEPQETDGVADQPERSDDSTELKIHRGFVHFGRTISNGFKHVGGSLQEVFTGRRTIDKDLPGE